MDTSEPAGLSRLQILRALEDLSHELRRQNVTGELCLFGGTVMVLAFNARVSTKDIDALFQPAPAVREAARRVGRYYPSDRIPVRTQYLVEALFEEGPP